MAKVKKTNAIRMVEQKKLSYQEYTYEWSEDHLDAGSVAQQIAHPEAIYKTLVAVGNKTGPIVAVIPGDHELDLKKIAKASGNKKVVPHIKVPVTKYINIERQWKVKLLVFCNAFILNDITII